MLKKVLSAILVFTMVFSMMSVSAFAAAAKEVEVVAPAAGSAVFYDASGADAGDVPGGDFKVDEIRKVSPPSNAIGIRITDDNGKVLGSHEFYTGNTSGAFFKITIPNDLTRHGAVVGAIVEENGVRVSHTGYGSNATTTIHAYLTPESVLYFTNITDTKTGQGSMFAGVECKHFFVERATSVPVEFTTSGKALDPGYVDGKYTATFVKLSGATKTETTSSSSSSSSSTASQQSGSSSSGASSTPSTPAASAEKKSHKGDLTSESAANVKYIFEYFFTENIFLAADLGIGEPLPADSTIAVALGDTKVDLAKAVFYSYNKELNSYRRITKSGSIDGKTLTVTDNGHGTYIVISLNGPIVRLNESKNG